MQPWKADLEIIFNQMIVDLNLAFNKLIAAKTLYDIGQEKIDQLDSRVLIWPRVGINSFIEPIPLEEIKKFKNEYPHFIIEVFHGKILHLWVECLIYGSKY